MKIVLYSIHLVIQSYLTFPKIPKTSGWQGGFLGHRYKLLSPQRAHCTELHNRLNREISLVEHCVIGCYWMLLVLSKTKRAIFFALHTSKTCESPIADRNHTARCNWKRPLHFTASGIQLADSWLKPLCTSVALFHVASLRSDSTISNRVPNTRR